MPLAVNEQSNEIKVLAEEWPLVDALMAGTRAMRAAKQSFLPRWPSEEDASYSARLATATLFPAYRRTVSVMSGKPFAKALTLSKDTPASIQTWAEDIDQQGVNLHAFAAEMFQLTIAGGLAGVLVDYPDTIVRDGNGRPLPRQPVRTVAEVEASGARPYWVRVRKNQILGWKSEIKQGAMRLTQLRLLEVVDEPDGEFGTKAVQQVRVLEPGSWRIYRAAEKGKGWEVVKQGTTSLKAIPFVPFYGRRDGFMLGRPPLIDLAYLNVKHWQSQSDQDTILHVARVPVLAVIGVDEENWELAVGASTAVRLPINASMQYVEHSGAAIEAGAKSLADLEDQMIQSGAELLVKKPGDRSATESANDAEGNKSDLQRIVETFEDALDQALQFTADYANLGSGGSVSLFKDFGAANLTEASAQLVISMQQAGLITKETAIKELQRRGELEDSIDPEVELAGVEAEGPAPGTMTDPGDDAQR